MASQDTIAAAIESGRKKAEEILASRSAALERRAASLAADTKTLALRVHIAAPAAAESVATLQTAGFLAAAGDSWFDYPFHDVLKRSKRMERFPRQYCSREVATMWPEMSLACC